MPVKEIPITEFETSDGQRFREKNEAERHAIEIDVRNRFDAFKHVAGYHDKAFTCIFKWELFKAGIIGQQDLDLAPVPPK